MSVPLNKESTVLTQLVLYVEEMMAMITQAIKTLSGILLPGIHQLPLPVVAVTVR